MENKDVKHIEGSAMIDPNNEYYNPDKNFNTGEQWAVVMTAGGAKKVRMGNISSQDSLEEKIEELANKERIGSITDLEKVTLENLRQKKENEVNRMLDDNRTTRVTALPDDVHGIEDEEQVISEGNKIQAPKEVKRSEG